LDFDQETPDKPTLSVQALWMMVAKTIGFGLGVVLPIILVRVFDRSQYGTFRQAFVLVTTANSMLSMGVGISAFYYLPRLRQGRARVVLNILLFNLAAGIVPFAVLLLYPRVLVRLFGGPELLPYAPLIAAVMLLTMFSSFLEIIATALQDVRRSTIFIVFAQLSKVILMTAAAVFWGSVGALLWAAVAQGILQTAILLWYLHTRFGAFWKCFDWAFFREQMGYAMPYGLHGVLFTMQSDMHNYFVSNAFGPASFAIYSVGCMQVPLLSLLRESITAVLIPRTSELQQRGDKRQILLTTIRAMRKTALIYLPAFALLAVLGRQLLVFLYTGAYEASWRIFAINLLMLPVLVLITDPVIRAFPEHRYFVIRVRLVLVAIQLGILWFGTRAIGMTGAVLVLVLVGLVERLVVAWRVANILNVRPADLRLLGGIGKIGLASAAAGAAAWILRNLLASAPPLVVLAVCGTLFALVFAGLVAGCGVLEPEERDLVRRQWARLRLTAKEAGR